MVSARSLGVVLFLTASTSVDAQQPLAGQWTLDRQRSLLSGRMATNAGTIAQTLRITLDSLGVLVSTQTTGGPLGNRTTSERFTPDSVARAFVPTDRVDSRESTGTRRAWWVPARRELHVAEQIQRVIGGERLSARNAHTWRVSANGDTLEVSSQTEGPRGTIPTRRVFTRLTAPRP